MATPNCVGKPCRVDVAVKLYPGIAAAPLLLGTLAGCGGRLIADALLHNWGGLPGNAELSSPSFVGRSAALAATAYYLLAYVTQVLPVSAAAGLVITVLVLQPSLSDLTGLPLDFTKPFADLLYFITRIPEPAPQPTPQPVVIRSHKSAGSALVGVGTPSGKPATGRRTPSKAMSAAGANPADAAAECSVEALPAVSAGRVTGGSPASKLSPATKAGRGAAAGASSGEDGAAAARPRRSNRRHASTAVAGGC
eukprot:gene9971-10125_t